MVQKPEYQRGMKTLDSVIGHKLNHTETIASKGTVRVVSRSFF